MDINFSEKRLIYLYESARLGTMRAASESLNMASSSICRHIGKLETELGMALIEKGRHRIQLTEAGQILCDYYGKRQQDRSAIFADLEDVRALRKGKIKIAMHEGFVSDILAPTLVDFIDSYDNIRIEVKTLPTTKEVTGMVTEDEVHFGIVFDPLDAPNVRIKMNVPQPLKAIVHPDHPIAGKQSVKLAELQKYPIFLNQNPSLRRILRTAEDLEQVKLDIVIKTNSFYLLKECLHGGKGISTLSELSVARELADGKLVSVPIDNPVLKKCVAAVITRLGRRLPVDAATLLRKIESNFSGWKGGFKETVL